MGDSHIVIPARFRLTRTCFRLKRKRNYFDFDSLGNDFFIGILIKHGGFLYSMGDSNIVWRIFV